MIPSSHQRLIVTPGEPAGIGAEILVQAHHHGARHLMVTFDDPDRLRAVRDMILVLISISLRLKAIDDAASLAPETLAVLPISWAEDITYGKPSQGNAPQVIKAIEDAVSLTKSGKAKGLSPALFKNQHLCRQGFKSPDIRNISASLIALMLCL